MELRDGREQRTFGQAIDDDMLNERDLWGGKSHLYVALGEYDTQVERYLHEFAPQQILIIESLDLQRESRQTLERVTEFLEIPSLSDEVALPQANTYAAPRHRWAAHLIWNQKTRAIGGLVPEAARRRFRQLAFDSQTPRPEMDSNDEKALRSYYEPSMKRLENLVGRPLPSLWGTELA